EKQANQRGYYDPDWDYIHKELLKKNVTLKLLHKEYEQEAEIQNKIPYAYRTFCEKYGHYGKKYKLTMPIHRKPGEILEVDWAICEALHIAQSTSTFSPALCSKYIVALDCLMP